MYIFIALNAGNSEDSFFLLNSIKLLLPKTYLIYINLSFKIFVSFYKNILFHIVGIRISVFFNF